jgi:multidrug efflux pump subunit AcrB
VVVLFALLVDFLVTGRVLSLFGLSLGGHGHEAHGSPVLIWAIRIALAVGGGFVGYLLNDALNRRILAFFKAFNRFFDWLGEGYGRIVGRLVRATTLLLVVYGGLMVLTWLGFSRVPVGFIPEQDKGYLVVNTQLPDGASLERTEEVMKRLDDMVRATPGVQHTLNIPGYSILTSNNISNAGGMFVILAPFEERIGAGLSAARVTADLRGKFRHIQEAVVVAFGAPPVDGLGNTGGFKLQVQDRADSGPEALQGATEAVIRAAGAQPGLVGLFSTYRAAQPQLYLDVDRAKAKALGVSLDDVFSTLQIYLGSSYANDFTRFGRNWQVNVQADAAFRVDPRASAS